MNTHSLSEINKTSNMNPNLITKHYKLKLMNDFMNIKYQNPRLRQCEIASQLDMSASTIQRYRNDIYIYICFHHTELTQITLKNNQKRLKSMIMVTSKDFK